MKMCGFLVDINFNFALLLLYYFKDKLVANRIMEYVKRKYCSKGDGIVAKLVD